jgi:hypothetical protein
VAVPSRPVRPRSTTRPGRVSPSAPIGTRRRTEAGRSSRGDHLFLVFVAATVIMVVAVVLVGAVDRMWVLVPVMLVDLAVTFAVIATLVSLIGDDDGPAA